MAFTDIHEIEEMFSGLSVFELGYKSQAASRSYHVLNPARKAQWREENREHLRKYNREYNRERRKDPEFVERWRKAEEKWLASLTPEQLEARKERRRQNTRTWKESRTPEQLEEIKRKKREYMRAKRAKPSAEPFEAPKQEGPVRFLRDKAGRIRVRSDIN